MRKSSGQQGRFDIDEVRPDLFVINEPQAQSVLRGEGEITGHFFRLRSWRRQGLLARLRERGFVVRTLDDRLAALPPPPAAVALGPALPRDIAGEKQGYALFDPQTLRWRTVEPATPDVQQIALPLGAVVRRRRGRGISSYARVIDVRGHAGLAPISEQEALLLAYAQAAASTSAEVLVRPVEKRFLLPSPGTLPPQYRTFVEALGETTPEGVLVNTRGWGLARQAYALLGLRLRVSGGANTTRTRGTRRPAKAPRARSRQAAAPNRPRPERAKRPPRSKKGSEQ